MEQKFKDYDKLGFINPFFKKQDKHIIIKDKLKELIKSNDENIIDPTAVIEILNRNNIFADRTIIQNIYKTPWMAKPNEDFTEWEYNTNLPKHNYNEDHTEAIAKKLFKKLKFEIFEYIKNHNKIGILLSGGMDSRIIACVLKYIQEHERNDLVVTAITWGIKGSRDVIYSNRIANNLNWEWKHFELTSDILERNIKKCAENGAIYSPIHLHAMEEVSKLDSIDCVIAGSFGDSIGRAEYSGTKVDNLVTVTKNLMNKFNFLKKNVFKQYKKNIYSDINQYRNLFPRNKEYEYCELEKQIHYMRKQLNQCMAVIDEKIPLYQAFTSPEVFGYMWSLKPSKRTDAVYFSLLEQYSIQLLDIPWARTGCRYLKENEDTPDNYSKTYHNYSEWIRYDLSKLIRDKVLSKNIKKMNIFNILSLKILVFIVLKLKLKMPMIEERLIWLAALSDCIKEYDIKGIETKSSLVDLYKGFESILQLFAFKIKNFK